MSPRMSVSPRYCAVVVMLATTMTAVAGASMHFPEFEGQSLTNGRAIWIDNCMGCHADGTADAPRPDTFTDWELRIEQPRDLLYEHAIEGFFGPDYAMMPPRGGNPSLNDTAVRSAVDYMLQLVEFYRTSPAQE